MTPIELGEASVTAIALAVPATIGAIGALWIGLINARKLNVAAVKQEVIHKNTNSLVAKLIKEAAEEARDDALSGNGGAGKKNHKNTKLKRKLK